MSDRKVRRNTDAGLIPRCGKGLFLLESTFSAASTKVLVQPPCAISCVNIAHVRSPKHWQPYHRLDTLAGMSNAGLVAAVTRPGKKT